jgi:hypothetical protein
LCCCPAAVSSSTSGIALFKSIPASGNQKSIACSNKDADFQCLFYLACKESI